MSFIFAHMKTSGYYKTTLYWIATAVTALAFIIPGILNLTHNPHMTKDMAHLGYPAYFPSILGSWKIAGAIVILLPGAPRLKEWAYAGMAFDLTGAALSRLSVGDPLPLVIVPVAILGIVVLSWAMRPGSRKLG